MFLVEKFLFGWILEFAVKKINGIKVSLPF